MPIDRREMLIEWLNERLDSESQNVLRLLLSLDAPTKVQAGPKQRGGMSPAARKRLSQLAKARWRAARKLGKKKL
jgi:hypothetical protein